MFLNEKPYSDDMSFAYGLGYSRSSDKNIDALVQFKYSNFEGAKFDPGIISPPFWGGNLYNSKVRMYDLQLSLVFHPDVTKPMFQGLLPYINIGVDIGAKHYEYTSVPGLYSTTSIEPFNHENEDFPNNNLMFKSFPVGGLGLQLFPNANISGFVEYHVDFSRVPERGENIRPSRQGFQVGITLNR